MKNYKISKNFQFFIFKPSKYFYFFSLVSLLIWFWLGPISYRHIDDYGPMYDFIEKYVLKTEYVFPTDLSKIDIFSTFLSSLRDNYGWGSYPHLWSIIYLPLSLSFIKYGIDITRYIIIFIGFSTCLLISFLLSNILTLMIINKKELTHKSFKKIRFLSEFFSTLIVFYCPQIMLHSITYMPYQIPAISTLYIFNIFLCFQKIEINNTSGNIIKNKYLYFSFEYTLILLWFSILLSWQNIFIIIGLTLYFINFLIINKNFYLLKKFAYDFYFSINNYLKKISLNPRYILFPFCLIFLFYFSRIYVIKLINLSKSGHINGIPFAWGLENEYNLNLFNLNVTHILPSEFFQNLIFVISRIFSLALYPFRFNQNISAFLCLIIFTISYYFLFKYSKIGSKLSILILFTFIVPIIFSILGEFILAPSRHSIYLFPCIWIPVGILFVHQFSFNHYLQSKNLLLILQIILIIIFFNGLILSHKAINLSKSQEYSIRNLAARADYFPLGKLAGQYDLVSLYWTHGTKEWEAIKNKECFYEGENLKGKTIFLYSHREFFKENSNHMQNLANPDFFPEDYACITKNTNLEILESIIIEKNLGIEVDNLIDNGGSNAYAYLLKVSK